MQLFLFHSHLSKYTMLLFQPYNLKHYHYKLIIPFNYLHKITSHINHQFRTFSKFYYFWIMENYMKINMFYFHPYYYCYNLLQDIIYQNLSYNYYFLYLAGSKLIMTTTSHLQYRITNNIDLQDYYIFLIFIPQYYHQQNLNYFP